MIPSDTLQRIRGEQLLPVYDFVLGELSGARGGQALGSAELGLEVQNWYGWLHDGWFYLRPDGGSWVQICATPGAISATFAFDRNMDPVVCWNTESTGAFLRYYDAPLASYQILHIADAKTAMVCHDDTRNAASSVSDVIVSYVKHSQLFYRYQRDRYSTERLLKSGVPSKLRSFGMSTENRLLWILR